MADIADQDEGRPAVRRGQAAGIAFRLPPCVHQQHVPRSPRVPPPESLRLAEQVHVVGEFLAAALLPALLGFENEATLLVEIDAARGECAVAVRLLHDPFEDVIVFFRRGGGRVGALHPEDVAQLRQEQAVVGALLAAFATLPSVNEGVEPFGLCKFRQSGAPS